MNARTCALASIAAGVVASCASAAIITFTTSGFTTLSAARERPPAAILGITPFSEIAQRLTLVWGVHAVHHQDIKSVDDMASMASDLATAESFARPGDRIVVTAGIPFHTPGTTNLLRVVKIDGSDSSGNRKL